MTTQTGTVLDSEALCRVCGRGVPRGRGKRPRELHPACKDFAKFWAAARRALERIEWEDSELGSAAAAKTRRELVMAANVIPYQNRHAERDQAGKFARSKA